MELVLAAHALKDHGGSEGYALTVAEQLEGLGHGVTMLVGELGPSGETARGRGLRVTESLAGLPPSLDAALTHDAQSAVRLAEARPSVPQVFVAHSPRVELQLPSPIGGATAAIVALNDRVRRRMEALPLEVEVVRLHQPIDLQRFQPRGEPPAQPRRALALSNYLRGQRAETIVDACARVGVECRLAGRHAGTLDRPEFAISDADFVIGYGRAALEGMASGRAVFVLDWFGRDGWVTPDSYPDLESDGFAGQGTDSVLYRDELVAELGRYTQPMGRINRDLAARRHGAHRHAIQLVELLGRAAGGDSGPGEPPAELGRLLRLLWRHEGRSRELEIENDQLRLQLHEARVELQASYRRLKEQRQPRALARLAVQRLAGKLSRDASK